MRKRRRINAGALALLITYVLVILYITLFSRWGERNTTVNLQAFGFLSEVMRKGSLEPARHFLLNVALFFPFGFLLPFVRPKRAAAGIVSGALLSFFIEAVQFVLEAGQCDIDDLIGNTAGTVFGILFFALMMGRRYEDFDD